MRSVLRLRARAGFTLVEILVAATITVILVAILLRISTLASTTVSLSTQKLSAFASARTAFDIITRNLSQATLNTYLDYYDGNVRRSASNSGSFSATSFGRASDLQFIIRANTVNPNYGQEVYFQAPRAYSAEASYQSVNGLLNACGYYIQFGSNDLYAPSAILGKEQAGTASARYRYRLMQGMEPTEDLHIFTSTAAALSGQMANSGSATWLDNIQNGSGQNSAYVTPLVDNVIAFVVWPRLSAANEAAETAAGTYVPPTNYNYDSQANVAPQGKAPPYTQSDTADQLPPDVQVTMVVLDEASALRVQGNSVTAPTVIEAALAGRFQDPTTYAKDINGLTSLLTADHLNYQLFNTTVAMRESEWTMSQH